MNRIGKTLLVTSIAFGLLALARSTCASPISLEFKTGLADDGGVVQLFSDGSIFGTGIPIGTLTVTGAPIGNGGYVVGGLASDSTAANDPFGYGSLSFATGGLAGTNFIQIDGYLPTAGVGSPASAVDLLSGTFSAFALAIDPDSHLPSGLTGNGKSVAPQLATLLGLSIDPEYTFMVSILSTDPLSVDTPGTAISTDVRNTAAVPDSVPVVPEPSSVVLLGSGLLAAGPIRLRLRARKRHE